MKKQLFNTVLLSVVFAVSAFGGNISFTTTPDKPSYAAGDTFTLAISAKIAPKYHLYGNPLGPGIGLPLIINTTNDAGLARVSLRSTQPVKMVQDEQNWVWAYEKEAHFFLTGIVATDAKAGPVSGTVQVDGLLCLTSCTPVHQTLPFTVTVGRTTTQPRFHSSPRLAALMATAVPMALGSGVTTAVAVAAAPSGQIPPSASADTPTAVEWAYTAIEKKPAMNLLMALLLAFIAGIILNAMPCVLPVLGIKVLSFAKESAAGRGGALRHSLVYAAGMMSVFMLLATLAAFAQFSWGQQFQNPFMMMVIICIIFVFSLSMFNLFTILMPSGVGNSGSRQGYAGDFLRGVITTVLATPCSGPFLGATLAWTLTQSPGVIYIVFFSLGAGMAFPYVILSTSKTAARLMPKPGMWMEDFKRLMGFVMLGFAVYLMFGLPRDMHVVCAGLCVALALAVVVYTRFAPFGSSIGRRVITACIALGIVAAGIYVNIGIVYNTTSEQAVEKARGNGTEDIWEPFDAQKLLQANANGEDAVVDFTANWCMNCQYNTVSVFNSPEVKALLKKKKVRAFLVDMTGPNPVGETLLRHLGSRSIPFFAVFPGTDPQNPVIMRDLVSKSAVVRELGKMGDD